MDFDHVKGKKTTEISTLMRSGYSLERIKKEVAKCEVVCACCHRVRTLKRMGTSSRPYSMYDVFTDNGKLLGN